MGPLIHVVWLPVMWRAIRYMIVDSTMCYLTVDHNGHHPTNVIPSSVTCIDPYSGPSD